VHSSNRPQMRHFRLGTPSRVSNILPLHKVVPSRSRRQAKVLSRTILPLCHTTILTRKTSTTDLRITLVMECLSPSSSTLLCSSLVPLALDLHLPPQRNKAPRPSHRNRIPMARICTVNNTRQLGMTSLVINTTRSNINTSTAIHRMRLACLRVSMENISSCMVVRRVCRASWGLDRAPDRPRGLR
jgi:hypothetical protein